MSGIEKKIKRTQPIIAASILSANFAALADDVRAALDAGAQEIHFDVMDHHFVPNLSFGALPCHALRKAGISAPIDVHLMVDTPEDYIEPFAKAGATRLSFHPETVSDVAATLQAINGADLKAGLVFNPDRNVVLKDKWLPQLDLILLMSVFPGFGGQAFIDDVLNKIKNTRQWLDEKHSACYLAVDGGIKTDNIAQVAAFGADFFVVGSGLFDAKDYKQRIIELQAQISIGYAGNVRW